MNERSNGSLAPLHADARVLAVVPHFACEEWLAICLESLVSQTRPLDGIVVVDDASPSPPTAIVARFPGVTLLTATSNVGPYRLVQQVIDDTDYDAYLFQDADDWSAADRLEGLLAAGAQTGAELVGSDYVMVRCNEASASLQAFPTDVNAALMSSPTAHALQHPTSLVARGLVERLGGFASGMRFSGDAEFLRRAAHVTRVVNVPRPLYFRRLRSDSLTTSSETGHGSPARRSVLEALAERAWRNVNAVERGEPPLIEPFSRAQSVELRHLEGPSLCDRGGARSGIVVPRHQVCSDRTASATVAPVFVVGADDGLAEALVWSLGQHPLVRPVPDASWISPLAVAAEHVASLAGRGQPVPNTGRRVGALDPLGIGGPELLDAVAAAIQRLATDRALAWVASLPSSREVTAAAAALFPEAKIIHVIRHVDECSPDRAEEWLTSSQIWLEAEERFGRDRVLRVRYRDLVDDPEAAMRGCIDLVGVAFHESCTWLLRSFTGPNGAVSADDAANPALQQARMLSTALCGPVRVATVGRIIHAPPRFDEVRLPAATASFAEPDHVRVPLALLRSAAPAGATVAVVSNGDSRLVDIGAATGWHFPRQTDGVWAGYHPATGETAVADLQELRSLGARYFFLPAWALWWLDHYDALREHLEVRARVAASSPSAGLLLELVDIASESSALDLLAYVPEDQRRKDVSDRLESFPMARRPRQRDRKVAVIAWSASHNPLGRAYLLAEMLRRRYDVELIGARFEHFGRGVWPPLRDAALETSTFPGADFPEHLWRMEEIAEQIDADAILVCKPRLPSLALGVLAKAARNRPLILDVDDHELTFVNADTGLTLGDVERHGDSPALLNPFGRLWTRYCESLIPHADRLIVSNASLQGQYGGSIVPHARDESVFDPARFDRDRVRAHHGFEDEERIILFAGTPRRHKGLLTILDALRQMGDARNKLCLLGTVEYEGLREDLAPYESWLRVLPYQPFGELPGLLAASDAVCVLQDPDDPVSRFQIPAKVTDALAMGVPCVVTPVAPLADVIASGGVEVHRDGEPLSHTLARLFDDPHRARETAARGREYFLGQASYRAVLPSLSAVIDTAIEAPCPMPAEFEQLIDFQRRRFGRAPAAAVEEAAPRIRPAVVSTPDVAPNRSTVRPSLDVALFWKQNDTGIYGRRHEMLTRQLAASPHVGSVVQFDAPVDLAKLMAGPRQVGPTHERLVLDRLVERLRGSGSTPGLVEYTFGYNGAEHGPDDWLARYVDYVRSAIAEHCSAERRLVFWVYPKNFEIPALVRAIEPDLILADIVDDHRTWARKGSERWHQIDRHYAEIVALSDVLVANCEPLANALGQMGKPVHVVPNGCEYPVVMTDTSVPVELAGLPRPIVGYLGNLSDRLDLELLEQLAGELGGGSVVLIGSTHAGTDVLRLDRFDNVHFLGPRPYGEAKRYVRAFDVGIIPHRDNEMTRAMNPLKAFVYCAVGVPVVSTRVANLAEMGDLITVADDHDAFVRAVRTAAVAGHRPHTRAQQERLLEHTWARRLDRMLALLEQEAPSRSAAPTFAMASP